MGYSGDLKKNWNGNLLLFWAFSIADALLFWFNYVTLRSMNFKFGGISNIWGAYVLDANGCIIAENTREISIWILCIEWHCVDVHGK